ncbi:alpha-galactosidase [Microbacterium sp. 1154]|uniref:alpha-galactosidase n=1 Tax=Microbacterium sp. 1154 TaxID=2817733 RepID=UPI002855136B|nr:alpha-galactosidase [Microbacterium sp. 1154]MDR6689684.1 alpha-galactosidase [Microbacterium sp. 1154]
MTTMQPAATGAVPTPTLGWGNDLVTLTFTWDAEEPVSCTAVEVSGRTVPVHRVPFVEVLTADAGHRPASGRLAHTEHGARMRYVSHDENVANGIHTLTILQRSGDLEARIELTARDGVAAVSSRIVIGNVGEGRLVLRAVASWVAGFTARGDEGDALAGWERLTGVSDWLGEGRWTRTPLRGPDFVPLAEHLTGHNPRGTFAAVSTGTWSTAHELPTGILESRRAHLALAWQIEHNGAWRWELGEDTPGGYLALSGPTDADAGWSHVLAPADRFESVPATVAFGSTAPAAVDALTDHRRAIRRPHPDNAAMPVVFNDYMNTLDGDPTTEKLLPLITAASEVGAEVFCIDAGWYDDSGHWWDTVGEWLPSTTRFPGGLGEVIDAIRAAGMVSGLWLEPEVVGIRSPLADRLPAEAFLQRNGERVVEHDRFHLDLRHPAARAHLDAVVDRLIADFGVGFFKMDYNINPGPGTDHDADSVGDGLLRHNRAVLDWLDGVLDRHPSLVVENCSSGAMRMDYAMLSRLAMQSTSDQQDFRKYPAIAVSAPLSILPEQAASWAYPQPEMDAEESAFCLVTGLLGRFYVSGHLNRMDAAQRDRVATAITVAQGLRTEIATSHPHWPLGLPRWDDPWLALGLRGANSDLVSIWRRGGAADVALDFPHLVGVAVEVTPVFPLDLPSWQTHWDAATGTLHVRGVDTRLAARTLRLTARPAESTPTPAPDHTDHIEGAIQ